MVSPELILPSEWLPVIWGGEEPEFRTEEEMRTVLGTIMGRYNEIVACLADDPDDLDPIFWEGPEGEVIASDWAGGFLDAVALRPQAWKPLMEETVSAFCSCHSSFSMVISNRIVDPMGSSMRTRSWQRPQT